MACKVGAPYHHQLLFLLFLSLFSTALLTSAQHFEQEKQPVDGTTLRPLMKTELRRRLGNFKGCALCTCCGGPKRVCVPSPCCYAINCNIPNRPFGVCSFTPKACNCFGCHL